MVFYHFGCKNRTSNCSNRTVVPYSLLCILSIHSTIRHPWPFQKAPKNFWSDVQNQRRYFDWLKEEIGIEKESEWHSVRKTDCEDHRRIFSSQHVQWKSSWLS